MSNEELVQLYQQGNTEVLQELLQQNKGFIYKISKKFFISKDNAIDYEDLIQEGYIGMIKAAGKYIPGSEAEFISYAYYWIYQSMHRFMYPKRYMRENKGIIINSLNEAIPGSDGGIEKVDMLVDDNIYPDITNDIAAKQDCVEVMNILRSKIGNRAVDVIKLRHGLKDGMRYTLSEVGESLGVTSETIRQLEQRAFRTIRASKWGRMRLVETNTRIKERTYDTGKLTQNFFATIDRELKGILNKVI